MKPTARDLQRARTQIQPHVLSATATYEDWQRVSDEARLHYCTVACQAAAKKDLGTAEPLRVVATIHNFYSIKPNRDVKLSLAFGNMFAAETVGRNK